MGFKSINTVGELRQVIVPFTDDCVISEISVEYYLRNGEGKLRIIAPPNLTSEKLLKPEEPAISAG